MRAGWYKRLFARHYDRMVADYEAYIEPRKRSLLANLEGTVLEIGPGTGANLRFLPRGSRWIGVEPNPYMHDFLRERARDAGIDARFDLASAGRIDVEDGAADVVVSTLVLCSVPDVDATLDELRRVLRPGGRFLFIEHVAAPRGTGLRWVQWGMGPVWRLCGDGCRIDRDIAASIERAGFSSLDLERFRVPMPPGLPWVSPHITGCAVR